MLPDKITIKLNIDELQTFEEVLQNTILVLNPEPNIIGAKQLLYLTLLGEIRKKLKMKIIFIKKKDISFSLTLPQAIAFYLFYKDEFYTNPFTNNLIESICRHILQKIT